MLIVCAYMALYILIFCRMGKLPLVLLLALFLVVQVTAAPLQEMGEEVAESAGGNVTIVFKPLTTNFNYR